ncbi:MAG: hypothetical protein V4457_06170 [Pseudomonadota bacterium]
MRGWFLVNLFLLALILIGAGLIFLGGSIFRWFDPGPGAPAIWSAAAVSVLVIVLLYYISKALHGFIERQINRRPKTR